MRPTLLQAAALDAAASGVPSLADIGYPPAGTTPFKGGESAALARMAGGMGGWGQLHHAWVVVGRGRRGVPADLPSLPRCSPGMRL